MCRHYCWLSRGLVRESHYNTRNIMIIINDNNTIAFGHHFKYNISQSRHKCDITNIYLIGTLHI